jgi:histidinol dehydrogenase
MIKIFEDGYDVKDVLNRGITDYSEYEGVVRRIIAEVRERGDAALLDYAKRFDKADIARLEVSAEEIEKACAETDENFLRILNCAADNIRQFHEKQKREGFRLEKNDGIILGQRITAVERAGVYVPGGTASYPSTVLMDVIPAKIAGVKQIVMTTPPQSDGSVKAEILAAAKTAGVDRIFKCGGAGAIAAMAFGTESVPAVDKIVGPGNIYVALAKKEVFGTVGIDMVAGPSEILVLADEAARADYVAADLLSQAEHDRLASAVLVTTGKTLAYAVRDELEKRLKQLPRESIARASIDTNGKIFVVRSMEEAFDLANEIAPEHLELAVEKPFEAFEKIKNAGSVFLGMNTPEALGDYYAGANHTLPTSGSARFSSPLSVDDFVKKTSFIYYTDTAMDKAADDIAEFASREGLYAHAKSALIRKLAASGKTPQQ